MAQIYRPNTNRLRVAAVTVICVILCILSYGFWASSHAAYMLDYQDVLGSPMFGRVYPPFAWMQWAFKYYHADPELFSHLYWGLLVISTASLVAGVTAVGLLTRKLPEYEDVHGTSRFLDNYEEIQATGLLPRKNEKEEGILLAVWDDKKKRRHYLRHPQIEHIQCFGPPGSGKGIAFVYNAIQTWDSSMVILDRKGSLHEMTSGHLAQRGYRVLRWAPLEPDNTIGINIINTIREDERYEVGDSQNFASSMMPTKEGSDSAFFTQAAMRLLAGVVLYAVRKTRIEENRRATLADLVALFGVANTDNKALYAAMKDNKLGWKPIIDERTGEHLRDERGVFLYERHPWISDMGAVAEKGAKSDKTDANIFETAFQRLFAATDPQVQRATADSNFQFDDLMNGDVKIALFLVIPPGEADLQRLNCIVTTMLSMMIETPMRKPLKPEGGRAKSPHKRTLMFLLDEIGNMGKVNSMPGALTLLREWGVKIIGVWQTKAQQDGTYGKENPILGASEIHLSFAPNDDITANWLSGSLGKITNVIRNMTMSGNRFAFGTHNMSVTTTTNERALLTTDEVRRLKAPTKDEKGRVTSPGEIIIMKRGSLPIKAIQALFWEIPAFKGRADIPALDKPDNMSPEKTAGANAQRPGQGGGATPTGMRRLPVAKPRAAQQRPA